MLRRIVNARSDEIRPLVLSFMYFFCLLCGYYIIRPVREEMGIQGGVENLPWLFGGTFLAMLVAVPIFGALAAKLPRRRLLPVVYYFFIANLLAFYVLFQTDIATPYIARAFFIWVSVFVLFVVSVFWSFMADLFTNEQARRLFGFFAAGGSAGALVGSGVVAGLAVPMGPVNLLVIAALFLVLAVVCIQRLGHWAVERERDTPAHSEPTSAAERHSNQAHGTGAPIGGGVWAGVKLISRSPYLLGICLYIWLFTTLSTWLYLEQAHLVAEASAESGERTELFGSINLAVNALAMLGQMFLTGRIVARIGLPMTLALVPVLMIFGFLALGAFPLLTVLVMFQVVRRAGNFIVAKPAREMLFTVVSREEKYKSKNVIDTVVYRGGDWLSAQAFAGLKALGLGLSGIAFTAVPLAITWLFTGLALGNKQEVLRRTNRPVADAQALTP